MKPMGCGLLCGIWWCRCANFGGIFLLGLYFGVAVYPDRGDKPVDQVIIIRMWC